MPEERATIARAAASLNDPDATTPAPPTPAEPAGDALREVLDAAEALFEQASHVHLGGHLPMAKIHTSAQNLGPLLTRYQQARTALTAMDTPKGGAE